METPLYDSIGTGYRQMRIPDERLGRRIREALGDATSILNVGAGAGSYEPLDDGVFAVEPSTVMVEQRSRRSNVCRAVAEHLPFAESTFDAALAVLTLHHWTSAERGLSEMLRVSRSRIVFVTWDRGYSGFWIDDYFPEVFDHDRKIFPSRQQLVRMLEEVGVEQIGIETLRVPHDCTDGFLGAYWKRPDRYLDPVARTSISTFSKLAPESVERGVDRLRDDLSTGAWATKHGSKVSALEEFDAGYLLVTVSLERQ